MSTITTIQSSDLITNSRADVNNNFANLNTDKEEVSNKDTDTTLAANSDTKYPSQKAVKAYVDAGGNVNASTTVKGIVEEATQAEVDAGTATGGTGARLFVNPSATQLASVTGLATAAKYSVGALNNTLAKTYFNMQMPFLLWTGSTNGALTTDYPNWVRNSTDVSVLAMGLSADFVGTGADYIITNDGTGFFGVAANPLVWSSAKTIILDFFALLPASGTGDINMGFVNIAADLQVAYNSTAAIRACFSLRSTGALYATISNTGVGVTNTDISSGLTLTNWNHYRIELHLGTDAKFYVNGVLKATLSGANLYASASGVMPGFGRSNTSLFTATAPNFSIQLI